ncbi:HAD-like protein [Polyplosphaeria fusca]|uniref:HAD-like protein n=1 Tax=Polyplosphaeria fusca TaxID=682080 RepID=A0A9P4QRN4_9PLEO|nr:HAD-like protein [Polyplosphaeria fusca]
MSVQPAIRPRRFAPLCPEKAVEGDERPVLKGIVFDVDGTLCEPQTYMFAEMRSALNITKQTDILDHIYSLPEPAQSRAQSQIRAIERTAMATQTPQPGLAPLMSYLDSRAIPKAICTRNFDAPVAHLLTTFLPHSKFAPIVTREFRPPKPDPAGINHIARSWGFAEAREMVMVGDSVDDMTAGWRAGAATVLLVNEVNRHLVRHEHTDLVIGRLDELIGILEEGFEGRGEVEVEDAVKVEQ